MLKMDLEYSNIALNYQQTWSACDHRWTIFVVTATFFDILRDDFTVSSSLSSSSSSSSTFAVDWNDNKHFYRTAENVYTAN